MVEASARQDQRQLLDLLARGELPFFLRLLRPARALPERRLEVMAAQLTRLLGPPIHEDEELAVWRL